MKLPGGLLLEGKIRQNVKMKPLTGRLERVIAESGLMTSHLPHQITCILTHAVVDIDGYEADENLIELLCSGDRSFLMQQLSGMINPYPQWLTMPCEHCHENLQIQWQAGKMPVKQANDAFPETQLSLSIGDVMARVPNGKDEQILATLGNDDENSLQHLLKRLITQTESSTKNNNLDLANLSENDKQKLDKTIENMMPQVADTLSTQCPYCQHPQQLSIGSYDWITEDNLGLDEEIHTIASQYHWSEQQILDLPTHRRQKYLQLINQQHASMHNMEA